MSIEAITETRDDPDFDAHVETYWSFLRVLRWITGAIALILIGLAIWAG